MTITKVPRGVIAEAFEQLRSGYKLIQEIDVTGLSVVDFLNIALNYDYLIDYYNVYMSALADITMLVSTDSGTTFKAGSTDYYYHQIYAPGNTLQASAVQTSYMLLTAGSVGTTDLQSATGEIKIINPMDPNAQTKIFGDALTNNPSNLLSIIARGFRVTKEANNAFRLKPSSGNFAGGKIRLWGIKR